MMQTGDAQLASQQEIMKAKGFYSGAIDGIWGPKTVEAKKKWELSGKFAPGLPNFGLPLKSRGPYPAGVMLVKETGLLTSIELEAAKAAKAAKALQAQQTKPAATAGEAE